MTDGTCIVINILDIQLLFYFLGLTSTAVVLPESGSETEEEGNSCLQKQRNLSRRLIQCNWFKNVYGICIFNFIICELYALIFIDGEKESAGYKGMLQAPTQAFLAETEGGEITENHKISGLFISLIFLKIFWIFYQSFLLDIFVNELSIS